MKKAKAEGNKNISLNNVGLKKKKKDISELKIP
jgi:hypothetical protein